MDASTEYLVPITMEALEEGGYLATSDTLQGLLAQGRTIAETLEIASDVARKIVESRLAQGEPLPLGLPSAPSLTLKTHWKIPISAPQ